MNSDIFERCYSFFNSINFGASDEVKIYWFLTRNLSGKNEHLCGDRFDKSLLSHPDNGQAIIHRKKGAVWKVALLKM